MPVENITEHYNKILDNASILEAADDALTETFFGEPWHWSIGLLVTMVLIYMKTEDLTVTSLPGMVVLIALVYFGKVTTVAMMPLAFIGVLAFAAFFYGILKESQRPG